MVADLQPAARPMFVAAAWIQAHCVVPDGDDRGNMLQLGDEQLSFILRHYDVKPRAKRGQKADAFVYRRSQLVRAQKWGKSPLVAAVTLLEAIGPARFDGWAGDSDIYACIDHGCHCGWVWEYRPGEAMGRPWTTAHIQITATSEDQTDNTYLALRPMVQLGPLLDLLPKVGEEFVRLPNDGLIEAVTSKATSRLGARITCAMQDETGLWLKSNGGHKLAETQRRGLAGMGGRAIETTNAWNPGDDSTAQRTFESKVADVQRDFRQPPASLSFANKRERRKIFQFNYAGAPWVSVDSIEADAAELMEKNPADAERFFGNRLVSGAGAWMSPMAPWEAKKEPRVVEDGTRVALGFDGSDGDDVTGIRLETLDGYQFTPTYGPDDRPAVWDPADWGGKVPRLEVATAIEEICERFDVVRAYLDPPFWSSEIDGWAATHGLKVFIKWATYRVVAMHAALERFRQDVMNSDSDFRHDGDEITKTHVRNAVMRTRGTTANEVGQLITRYILGKPTDHQKIDLAMSSVLAHEAAMDAIAAGVEPVETPRRTLIYF